VEDLQIPGLLDILLLLHVFSYGQVAIIFSIGGLDGVQDYNMKTGDMKKCAVFQYLIG